MLDKWKSIFGGSPTIMIHLHLLYEKLQIYPGLDKELETAAFCASIGHVFLNFVSEK